MELEKWYFLMLIEITIYNAIISKAKVLEYHWCIVGNILIGGVVMWQSRRCHFEGGKKVELVS